LKFNGVESKPIYTNVGVPQGSPISPILDMFYNADLLEIPGERSEVLSLGFIDDIAYRVQGESEEGNARELERMLIEAERWREMHGAKFEESKYVLVHFTRARSRNIADAAHIHIGATTIKLAEEAKYLRVLFDRKLAFRKHIQYAAKNSHSQSQESPTVQEAQYFSKLKPCLLLLQPHEWTMQLLCGTDPSKAPKPRIDNQR